MFPLDLLDAARQTIALCVKHRRKIVTAESCTGGLVAALLTEISGASEVFERGFVTYSDDSKTDLLGVLPETLADYGAVSAEVAEAMAEGALAYSLADIAVSITGIAGPSGATATKPVGLVFFALATRDGAMLHYRCDFKGDRGMVRLQSCAEALKLLQSGVEGERVI